MVAAKELALTPAADPADRHGRRLWTGTWTVAVPRYGSFNTILARGGAAVRSTGGDLVAVRPPVRHPAGSLGATLGADLSVTHVPLQLGNDTGQAVVTASARPGDEIGLLRLAGVQAVRVWGNWRLVDRTPGAGRAGVIAREIDAIAAAGMSTLFILGGTLDHTVPPLADWEAYVTACLRHYGGTSGPVRWWEVVNEASNGWTAEQYMPVLMASHRLVKAAAPPTW